MQKTLAVLVALSCLSGCGGASMGSSPSSTGSSGSAGGASSPAGSALPPAIASAKAAGTPVDPAIVAADNAFGFALFQELSSGATVNTAFSPLSAALLLQIAYNGAKGSTQPAMAQTLQLGSLGVTALNEDNAALQAALSDPDPQVSFTIANSLWSRLSANPILPAFTAVDENYYGATVGDLAGAPADVNAWISNATGGLITSFGNKPASYYSGLTALLLNAIYFKGGWSEQFDPTLTAAAPFTQSDGAQISAPLMHQSSSYGYFQGANFQMVRLPYGQGHVSFLIMLPGSGANFSEFLSALTLDQLTSAIASLQVSPGAIALPKFTVSFDASLVAPLKSLGMTSAFCPTGNLSGIAPGACLSDVVQQTVIEVDETGTTAASVTGGGVTVTAAQRPFNLTCDHPFLYAIRDDDTGVLLFLGAFEGPAAAQ